MELTTTLIAVIRRAIGLYYIDSLKDMMQGSRLLKSLVLA